MLIEQKAGKVISKRNSEQPAKTRRATMMSHNSDETKLQTKGGPSSRNVAQGDPATSSTNQSQSLVEQETDVALHFGKRLDESGIFLNNIQVGLPWRWKNAME